MDNSRFTILIVPNTKASCRKIKICSRTIYYAFIVLAIFAAVGIGTILHYVRINKQADSIREENASLKASLQESQLLADKLNRKISALTRLSGRLKAISGMPTLAKKSPRSLTTFGMGGVTQGRFEKDGELGLLERKAEILEQSLKGLQSYIQTEKPFSRPSLFPTEGFVSSPFGGRRNPFSNLPDFHEGIDISGQHGAPVLATAQGKVTMAGFYGSFGLTIQIEHDNGMQTLFGHLSKVLVKPGEDVRKGQKIGLMGNTGMSTGPHLHYEVRVNDQPVNPRPYLLQSKS